MLKGSEKEDVESFHIKIADIKRENYSVIKVENTNLWKTLICGNILNRSYTKH
jgi:type II secretory pathway component PulL